MKTQFLEMLAGMAALFLLAVLLISANELGLRKPSKVAKDALVDFFWPLRVKDILKGWKHLPEVIGLFQV
ncbi:MAG: hypothetical protein UY41_C0041G0001 [Candidatus Moranbacteria bacterium GW2011_GWE1_49_15]|nr:MAG: hypothetical protein UX75_C0022G0009 [Candidatus Moranbacteria bacterium GW2011_GWE2_47_10]KKW05741.1 MAG: hypothetical protein UY41_C0041G0001 [Candidatus Moranbacteria bacterium GW2011_GWE1_49_15]HBP01209.1 hypothetical protein [Candidatus Moranbacteria bacterium]